MTEAVRVHTRYEIPDDNGDTRRARNERVGEYTPPFQIPETGDYLWHIFQRLNTCISRTRESSYKLMSPSDVESWLRLTGTLVYPFEYDILCAMDRAFCEEANKELENIRSKREEEQQKQVELARRKSRHG